MLFLHCSIALMTCVESSIAAVSDEANRGAYFGVHWHIKRFTNGDAYGRFANSSQCSDKRLNVIRGDHFLQFSLSDFAASGQREVIDDVELRRNFEFSDAAVAVGLQLL